MKMNSKKSRSLSDDAFNQKLQESIQVIQEMEEVTLLKHFEQFLDCEDHQEILNKEKNFSFFRNPMHEYFYILENPDVKYVKINKNLHVVYECIGNIHKRFKNYDQAIEFYKLEHMLTKVDASPLLKISQIYLIQERYFEMQKCLMISKPLLSLHKQFIKYFEIWADYFLTQNENEKAFLYIKLAENYSLNLDLDTSCFDEKYKLHLKSQRNPFRNRQSKAYLQRHS
jgi:hypothetical protein